MNILTTPHPVLTTPSKPVARVDKKIQRIVVEMKKTLVAQTDPEGVGLAAPQVGVAIRLFIMKKNEKAPLKVFINPEIVDRQDPSSSRQSGTTKGQAKLEGCLSIPRLWGRVDRATKVELTYTDLAGKTITAWFSGFEALIVQHEIDHLSGILFTKRVLESGGKLYREEKGELKEWALV